MKKKVFILTVFVCLLASFCLTAAPGEKKSSEIDTKIKMFSDYLLGDEPPGDDCKEGFKALIDAIVLMLPRAGYPEAVNNRIITASDLLKKTSIFNPKGIQLLKDAYRSINDGKDFCMPETSNLHEIVEYGRKYVKMSRENIKQGKTGLAVKLLLDTAIMVVTPVVKKKS